MASVTLREAEASSIRAFLESAGNAGLFSEQVLDFGCGKAPYRDLIEGFGADYTGYDRAAFPANVSGEDVGDDELWYLDDFDTIVLTQVLQYIPIVPYYDGLQSVLGQIHLALGTGGHLVATYATHWPEVESDDLHRFTKAGMENLLIDVGFTIVEHVPRHATKLPGGEMLVHGYGVIARA